MNQRNPEFIIKGIVEGESGRLTVVGRCGDDPVDVNDVFDIVFRNKQRRFPEESGQAPVREEQKSIRLRVECIHAYDRSLRQLGQGMTGSLVLEGDGRDCLEPGWILGTQTH
jgi:hypothetical protein